MWWLHFFRITFWLLLLLLLLLLLVVVVVVVFFVGALDRNTRQPGLEGRERSMYGKSYNLGPALPS